VESVLSTLQYTYGSYLDEIWTIDDRSGSITIADFNDSSGSERHFAHANTLYHIYGLTDETGAILEGYQYDAYGKATVFTDGNANGTVDFDGTDDTANWSSVNNPYQYTGQRYDPETGWMYYKNRYYDTDLGRFISRDPVGYRNGMNLYVYVNSRPMKYLDPYGLSLIEGPLPPPRGPVNPGPFGPGPLPPLGPGPLPPFGPLPVPEIPESEIYAFLSGCPGTAVGAAKNGAWCADTDFSEKEGLDCFREVPFMPEILGYGRPGKQCCYNKDGSFAYPSHDKVNPVIGVIPGSGPKGNTCDISKGLTGIRHILKDYLPYHCGKIDDAAEKAHKNIMEEIFK